MAFSKVTLNGDTLMDVTQKTVTAASMLSGTTALKNDGTDITGNIASKSSTDLTASGATVTAPAGYYPSAASKSVATGTAGTPTASKGTVSNHAVSVTPSVTNTTGYITGGTKTGTAVTVSASELVSGTKSITTSGTTDVTNYAFASVAAGSATTPATSITANPSVSIDVTPGKNLFDQSCLLAASGWQEDGGDYYGQIRRVYEEYDTGVPIYGGYKANTQYTVSMSVHIETSQSGNGLLVQAHYSNDTYETLFTVANSQTSWTRVSGTTASGKTVSKISISYSSGGAYVWHIKEVMIEESASVSTYEAYALSASVNATVSASKSVTPTVSAGYVSSGTAGTVSVSGSNTEQLTTQAATTYHPSTTDQTIASGKYLTGTQTINAVVTTNLTAANIADGVTVKIGDSTDDDCVASITGTHSGGGGGLEYESGTWTPASDVARGEISFSKTYTVPPSFFVIADISSPSTSASGDNKYAHYFDSYRLFGSGFSRNASATYYGVVDFGHYDGMQRQFFTTNSDDTSLSTASYSRYWVDTQKLYPYTNSTSRYWRSGRTYKWIAVWAPTT